jgi:hypothetical protein
MAASFAAEQLVGGNFVEVRREREREQRGEQHVEA